ncbi:MAG TPA: AraC family transcriptional regulator [Aliidongia sp.]|uniref:AraC family transcriptional regulator n=1 Tax=Aliidongia sp. TaxID=1914230 RepID=UPI002DDCFD54|nr:AraC family transcriptional regulator [Aliidongia sp.]HEV2673816.1 AraC family transcriptional regulator [Aliidongia sp.]
MADRTHRVQQYRSALAGVDAMSLVSSHVFPRHAHDHFGIGVIAFGAQHSWSGIGPVDAGAGDTIMVNPGEMHDGAPLAGAARGWHMLYFDPAVLAHQMAEEMTRPIEIARPAVSDPMLAARFQRLFVRLTAPAPDLLAVEEDLLRSVMHVLRHHGVARPVAAGPSPAVAKALQRLDEAPELPVSLGELAALSGVSRFQLLRGFARELGVTPHAYLVQRRVRLVRRLLAAGQPLAQAAGDAGFADQSHMTRAFVRQFGVTPGRYRAAIA